MSGMEQAVKNIFPFEYFQMLMQEFGCVLKEYAVWGEVMNHGCVQLALKLTLWKKTFLFCCVDFVADYEVAS